MIEPTCHACGDSLPKYKHGYGNSVTGRAGRYCQVCFQELEHGIIKNQNIHFTGGTGRFDEDAGSYQANARRALEDG